MSVDAVLIESANGFDFNIGSNGDIETENFFDTAILMSIFCERRATASEVPESHPSVPGFFKDILKQHPCQSSYLVVFMEVKSEAAGLVRTNSRFPAFM